MTSIRSNLSFEMSSIFRQRWPLVKSYELILAAVVFVLTGYLMTGSLQFHGTELAGKARL